MLTQFFFIPFLRKLLSKKQILLDNIKLKVKRNIITNVPLFK